MTDHTPDSAVVDLEGALTNLNTARQALSLFLEAESMQNHGQLEIGYCILITLDQAHRHGLAAWKILWEALPLKAGEQDKPPLKAVQE